MGVCGELRAGASCCSPLDSIQRCTHPAPGLICFANTSSRERETLALGYCFEL